MTIAFSPMARWSAAVRYAGRPGRRYAMPLTEVDDGVYSAMHSISRTLSTSIYAACRMAYREFVENHRDLVRGMPGGGEEPPETVEWRP